MARFQFSLVGIALFMFVSLLIPSISAEFKDVSYCTRRLYPVSVSGVEINPYPVARGKEATFSIAAYTDKPISGGNLAIDVSYFGVHIHNENHDLCDETSCPVAEGNFVIAHSQVLPGFTPPGSYRLRMKLLDGEQSELTCIHFDFNIGLGASDAVADS